MRGFLIALAFLGAPVAAQDHPLLADGKAAYDFLCQKCHGKDLVNPGTSSFDLREFPQDDRERFYESVSNGRGDMPAMADILREGELDALWVYVATRAGTEPFPEEADDAALKTPDGVLTACLPRNAGALSAMRHDGGEGFDYRVSEALAEALGAELAVLWVESEVEEESDPVREAYALLASGMCDMVPGHPLYAGAVGAPPTDRASLPRWVGMPEEADLATGHRQIKDVPMVSLEPVAVTAPYMRAEIALAFVGVEPEGLQDLAGRTLALQQGTLSGAIALAQAPEAVTAAAKSFVPGPGFLWEVENGAADVAIVDVAAFDAHRKQNPVSRLRLAEWRHPLGFDIGIAVLEERADLRGALSAAIAELRRSGALAEMAEEEGAHYARPHSNQIRPRLTGADLMARN